MKSSKNIPWLFFNVIGTGVLLERERMILEMADREGSSTPRPLIVIDCKYSIWLQLFEIDLISSLQRLTGMLLLLKECHTYGRYNNKSCHHKNVELLMAFKKSCGNMIKFATKNIPLALIQVRPNDLLSTAA